MRTPSELPKPEDVLAEWVRTAIKKVEYGEVSLKIHIHQGKVVTSEKSIMHKDKYQK